MTVMEPQPATRVRCIATDGTTHDVPVRSKILDYKEDRPAWIEGRRRFIGSSDVWSIVSGQKLYQTWASKTHPELCEPFPELLGEFGRWNEPGIAAWHAKKTGETVVNPGDHLILVHPEIPYLASSIDRFALRAETWTVCELKTAGGHTAEEQEDNLAYSGWRDHVPFGHAMQVMQQLEVTGLEVGQVSAILLDGAPEWHPYDVERSERFIELMLEKCEQFWTRYVLRDEPPPPTSDDRTADRILNLLGRPMPGKTYVLPASMGRFGGAWDRTTRRIKRAERVKEAIKLRVKHAALLRDEQGQLIPREDGKFERAESLRIEERGLFDGWTWKESRNGTAQFRRKAPRRK